MEGRTIDGFVLEDRDQFIDMDDHDLRVQIVETLIELAIRSGRPALFEMMDSMQGCASHSQLPPQFRPATPDETAGFASQIAAIMQAFRRWLPGESSMALMPMIRPDTEQIDALVVFALGERTSKVLWRHGRAADDELRLSDTPQHCQNQTLSGDDERDPEEVYSDLDEMCGYVPFNLDELPTTENRD